MGFLIHSVDGGHVPGWEHLPCGEFNVTIGLAMVLGNGNLIPATGSTKPTHICMCEKNAEGGDIIPVIRADSGIVFETTVTKTPTFKLGDKVTLSGDGTQITASTENGVAEVVYIDGDAAGCKIRVRF